MGFGFLFCIFASSLSALAVEAPGGSTYTLGPQDKIEIKVNDIRSGLGEVHAWPSFDGEFTVNPDGYLSLPLVGEVAAVGKSTSEIAAIISGSVKSEVGLAQSPKVAVQIVKFRPFYIIGSVEKPGEYEFRPGLDVLQALSIAGGLVRQPGTIVAGYKRDALLQKGEIKSLEAEKIALQIKLARLDADLAGSETISLNPSIKDMLKDPTLAKMYQQESLILSTQKTAIKALRKALLDEQESLKKELATLSDKSTTLERQISISRSDLEQVQSMIGRGLTSTARQVGAEQSLASYQNSLLDVQLGSIRAKESISKSERDLIDLEAKHRGDVLKEGNEVRSKIAIISEKLDVGARLIDHAESSMRSADAQSAELFKLRYTLTTRQGSTVRSRVVPASELMKPGDVLDVGVEAKLKGAADGINFAQEER